MCNNKHVEFIENLVSLVWVVCVYLSLVAVGMNWVELTLRLTCSECRLGLQKMSYSMGTDPMEWESF